jgi:hypothetical protein
VAHGFNTTEKKFQQAKEGGFTAFKPGAAKAGVKYVKKAKAKPEKPAAK